MRRRHELSDAEWARLEPLLPPRQAGRPRKDDRLVVNGILWKLATGAPWRDLPERYGPWQTVYTRFRRWTAAGVWDRIFAAVQRQADAAGQIDWDVHFVDGTTVRAHQHAAGAKGGPSGRSARP
jgi:transposase